MAMVPVEMVSAVGVVKDQLPHELPPEALSDVLNVRFADGAIRKVKGRSQQLGTPQVAPLWLLPWNEPSGYKWIYAGTAQVWMTTLGGTHTNITRYTTNPGDNDYTASSTSVWSGGVLNGVPILNHDGGSDYPQRWNPSTQRLQDLDNWPSGAYCRIIRPFQNFLVALDLTEGGTRYPYRVRWSDVADPGTVPGSWNEADPTTLAGTQELADTAGYVVDGLALGRSFVIYKEDSIYLMTPTGNFVYPFRFDRVTTVMGILAPRCAKEFNKMHFLVGNNDIVVFDGQRVQSVTRSRVRRWFYQNLDPAYSRRVFVVADYVFHEMLVCFPQQGTTTGFADTALVWNWEEDTWSVRELPNVAHIGYGQLDLTGGDSFDASAGVTFDNDTGPFGFGGLDPVSLRLVGAVYDTTSPKLLYLRDDSYTDEAGNAYTSRVERLGLAVAGRARSGEPKVDPAAIKFVRRVYPKVSWSGGTPPTLNIYVGGQDTPDGSVTWQGPFTFNPGSQEYVDCSVNARYLAWRVEDSGSVAWRLTGLVFDLDVVGVL